MILHILGKNKQMSFFSKVRLLRGHMHLYAQAADKKAKT